MKKTRNYLLLILAQLLFLVVLFAALRWYDVTRPGPVSLYEVSQPLSFDPAEAEDASAGDDLALGAAHALAALEPFRRDTRTRGAGVVGAGRALLLVPGTDENERWYWSRILVEAARRGWTALLFDPMEAPRLVGPLDSAGRPLSSDERRLEALKGAAIYLRSCGADELCLWSFGAGTALSLAAEAVPAAVQGKEGHNRGFDAFVRFFEPAGTGPGGVLGVEDPDEEGATPTGQDGSRVLHLGRADGGFGTGRASREDRAWDEAVRKAFAFSSDALAATTP